ncbi:MAG: hypothetical protein WCC32_00045 [Terriglobales bacterium]
MPTLMMLAILMSCVSQAAAAASKAENLERGVIGPVSANVSWGGFSDLSLVPGAGLIPISSTQTVFYIGFTAGATADVNNMVLYTTARGSSTITAVTPITLGGVSNPSIDLANPTVCPVIEISEFNPCIVRLDPTKLVLSALSDYYLVIYFTPDDSNNGAIGATVPRFSLSSLNGWYISGDESRLTVGASIPSGNDGGQPDFLMYVMND